jgi:predicted DNA-binding transcriptional regulator AlpA
MTSGDDKLRSSAAAELAGVKLSTWSSYVARKQAPKPDGHYDRRTPWWLRSTVNDWKASRPGQGSRKHTTAKPREAAAGSTLATKPAG